MGLFYLILGNLELEIHFVHLIFLSRFARFLYIGVALPYTADPLIFYSFDTAGFIILWVFFFAVAGNRAKWSGGDYMRVDRVEIK